MVKRYAHSRCARTEDPPSPYVTALITVADRNFLGKITARIIKLDDELPSVTSKISVLKTY